MSRPDRPFPIAFPAPRLLLLIVSGLLATLPPGGGALHAQVLTPDESVRLALEHHPDVRAARSRVRGADAARAGVRGARFPSLAARAGYTRLSANVPPAEVTLPGSDTTFTFLPLALDRYDADVTVEQTLFAGGRLLREERAAGRALTAAERDLDHAAARVAFEVRQAWWTLQRTAALLDGLVASRAHMEAHVRDLQSRVDEGTVLTSDLLLARTRLGEIRLEEVDADNAAALARLELNRLTGRPLDAPVDAVLPGGAAAGGDPADPLAAVSGAGPDPASGPAPPLAEHPALQSLEANAGALEARAAALRGDRLPQVSVFGRLLYGRPNPNFFLEPDRFRGNWEAGVAARWSLWEGGRQGAREAEALSALEGARVELDRLTEELEVALHARRLEVERAALAVEVAISTEEAAAEAFRVVQQRFDEDLALPVQVLEAEAALRTARARRAASVAERAVADAALLLARGRVW